MPPLLRRPEVPLCVIPYLRFYIINHSFRFALIIGIDEYANTSKLSGAVADAKAMKQYLEKHFRVPEANIVSLFNEEASRLEIIKAFRKLRDNELIEKGDPTVIYYSGHGCERPAPDAWGPGSKIQCLVPQDYEAVGTELIRDRAPIPDRVIGALLEDIAEKKGDNILSAIPCFVFFINFLITMYRLSFLTVVIQPLSVEIKAENTRNIYPALFILISTFQKLSMSTSGEADLDQSLMVS